VNTNPREPHRARRDETAVRGKVARDLEAALWPADVHPGDRQLVGALQE
jgi:hypothetical protein